MADRDPWIKFRPDYWLNDLELRSCSPTAKAALVDLMCIMHASRKYGHLLVNSTKPELKDVGRWFGWGPTLFKKSVEELLLKGALKQDDQGVIYSQRLVLDWEERQEMRRRGSLGGNPELDKQKVKQGVNQPSCKVVKADKKRIRIREEGEGEPVPIVDNFVSAAQEINGWGFTEDQDADFFSRLLVEFPQALIAKVIEDLRVYQEKPAKVYKNLHSALRNWCKLEISRNPEEIRVKTHEDPHGNPLVCIDGEWITSKEFDRARVDGKIVRSGDTWTRKKEGTSD